MSTHRSGAWFKRVVGDDWVEVEPGIYRHMRELAADERRIASLQQPGADDLQLV